MYGVNIWLLATAHQFSTMTRTRTTDHSRLFSSEKAFLTDQFKSNLKSNFYGKMRNQDEDKQSRVCFAESLETVHEIPYQHIFSKADFHNLSLPVIPVHKYVPLIVCDPFAKPVKKNKLDNLFVEDPFKLPFINPDHGMGLGFGQKPHGKSRITMNKNQAKTPAAQTNTNKGEKGEKTLANTVHFRYSDFILRKMDAVSYEKG